MAGIVTEAIRSELAQLRSENIYTIVGEFDEKTGELCDIQDSRINPHFKQFQISGDDVRDIDGSPLPIDCEAHPTLPIHEHLQTKSQRLAFMTKIKEEVAKMAEEMEEIQEPSWDPEKDFELFSKNLDVVFNLLKFKQN